MIEFLLSEGLLILVKLAALGIAIGVRKFIKTRTTKEQREIAKQVAEEVYALLEDKYGDDVRDRLNEFYKIVNKKFEDMGLDIEAEDVEGIIKDVIRKKKMEEQHIRVLTNKS